MEYKTFTSNHILRIWYKDRTEYVDFLLTEKEWDRFQVRLSNITKEDDLEIIEQIDESFCVINVRNIANAYFLYEPLGRSYQIPNDKDADENWSITLLFSTEAKTNVIYISDYDEMGELYMSMYNEQGIAENEKNVFLGFIDGDGENFLFNRNELLYFSIPKTLIDAGLEEIKED